MRAVKSVSIDSERRVIITYLDGSTETLYPNCIWCDSEALRQLIKDLLEEKADAITQTIENVTIASFADGADEGLIKKLLVSIDPIQEGSGDPSPENVRPISGRTGLTVSHSGADTSDPATISVNWETEAGTVYGGNIDIVSGKLTVDRVMFSRNTSTMNNQESYPGWKNTGITDVIGAGIQRNDYRALGNIGTLFGINTSGSSTGSIYLPTSRYGKTQSEWIAEAIDVQILFDAVNPIEYQLTPQEVRTLLGDNNIWADSGNILELEYTADTKLYIGEQQSDTLGSGRESITIPDLQPVSEKTWEDVESAYKEEPTDERGEE